MIDYFSSSIWNKLIKTLPNPHLLQTREWGVVKKGYGWHPSYALWKSDGSFSITLDNDNDRQMESAIQQYTTEEILAAALILKRNLSFGSLTRPLSVIYLPKGPLLDWSDDKLRGRVLRDLISFAKQEGAIFIKIDPDVPMGQGLPGTADEIPDQLGLSVITHLQSCNWLLSDEQVQFRNTCIIDLTKSEDDLLSSMKQKTRYNIRLAERKGVVIHHGGVRDIPLLYQMYVETSHRDKFIIREEKYYERVLQTFMSDDSDKADDNPTSIALIAEIAGEPIAALVVFIFAGKAWFLYGMSRETHRDKMPNYLLQWEAIRYVKRLGCKTYDLWGAPDQFDESDPLWGVFRFKEGLGGTVVRHIGAWDYPIKPILYRIYTQILPRILSLLRQRRENQRIVG